MLSILQRKKAEGLVAGYLEGGEYEEATIRIRSVIHADERLKAYSLVEIYVSQIKEAASYLEKEKEIPENLLTVGSTSGVYLYMQYLYSNHSSTNCFEITQAVCTVLYSTKYLSADLAEIEDISRMLLKSFGSSINKTLGCSNLAGKLVKANAVELGHTDGKVVQYLRQSDPRAADKKERILEVCRQRNMQINMELLDIHVLGPGARVQQEALRTYAGQRTGGQEADEPQSYIPRVPSDNNRRPMAPSGGPGPQGQSGKKEKGKKSPSSTTKTHEAAKKMKDLNSYREKSNRRSISSSNETKHTGRKVTHIAEWEISVPADEPDYQQTPTQSRSQMAPGWGPQMPVNHYMTSPGEKYNSCGEYLAQKHHRRGSSTISSQLSKEEDEITSIARDAAGANSTVSSHCRESSSSSCLEALKGLNNLDLGD